MQNMKMVQIVSSGVGLFVLTLVAFSRAQLTQDVSSYLTQYGYLTSRSDGSLTPENNITAAIIHFQRQAHLPLTGVLDETTLNKMKEPRCGVSDKSRRSSHRTRRYSHGGSVWNKTDITWTIKRYTHTLEDSMVRITIHRAFQKWSKITNLNFLYTTPDQIADIEILFVSGQHHDRYRFDGRGGVVAHAFYPPESSEMRYIGGDIHFDEDEIWRLGDPAINEQNLFVVALHEIGHALGLGHSHVQDSIMFPWTRSEAVSYNSRLNYDDVIAIQSLYGAREEINGGDESELVDIDYLCKYNIDDLLISLDHKLYAFRDFLVDELSLRTLQPVNSNSRLITDVFQGYPTNQSVDSAITYRGIWRNAKTYLFYGKKYYRFSLGNSGNILDRGYPKLISFGWGMSETNMNSIFVLRYPRNSPRLIFAKGERYWLHTGTNEGPLKNYPRQLTTHPILSQLSDIQAAFQHVNTSTYFKTSTGVYRSDSTRRDDSQLVIRVC